MSMLLSLSPEERSATLLSVCSAVNTVVEIRRVYLLDNILLHL